MSLKPDFERGAQFGDCRVTGERVSLLAGKGVKTHLKLEALPPGTAYGALYLRCTKTGPFKFAGKHHATGETVEFETKWTSKAKSNGVNGFIYDSNGSLHIIAPGPNVTSQGYRQEFNGTLVGGDATYGPFHGLNEYSYITPTLIIGQGNDDAKPPVPTGAVLLDLSTMEYRMLRAGYATFIRTDTVGQFVAIALTTNTGVEFYFTTIAELMSIAVMPNLGSPKPNPGPPPTVPAPPKPEPPMPFAPNRLETVRATINAHPEVNRMEDGQQGRGQMTDFVVQALGGFPWGRKDRDTNPDNQNNSDDALCYKVGEKFEIYDILSGSDGSATWDYKGTFADGENGYFRLVPTVIPFPPGPSAPPEVPGNPPSEPVLAALAAFVADVRRRLSDLEARPAGTGGSASDTFTGGKFSIQGSTGKFFRLEKNGDFSVTSDAHAGEFEEFILKKV
jgi:hypothetical protein